MAISVDCSSCGKTLRAKDDAAGKTAKCPACGEKIQIPAISEVVDAEDDFSSLTPSAVSSSQYSPDDLTDGDDKKPCPMCAEMIVATAKKCKFCGEIFDAKLKKAKKKSASGGGEDMGVGEWIVCLLCPGIGCIVGIVYAIQGKSNGGKMIGISLVMIVFWNVIRFAIENAARQ